MSNISGSVGREFFMGGGGAGRLDETQMAPSSLGQDAPLPQEGYPVTVPSPSVIWKLPSHFRFQFTFEAPVSMEIHVVSVCLVYDGVYYCR